MSNILPEPLIEFLLRVCEQPRLSRDLTILKDGCFLSKPLDSGKTFFDISFITEQIGMGFEAATPEKMKGTCPS